MKKLIGVVLAVVLIIGFVIYFHEVSKADSERARSEALESQHRFNQASASINADIVYERSRLLEYTKGPIAAMEYRQCKNNPPKLAKNQEKCKQFDEFLNKYAAEQEKHPSW
jgi:uncharacterized protein HemX